MSDLREEGKPTVVGALDMESEADRGTLRAAVNSQKPGSRVKRWGGITDEKKQQYVQALDVALRLALEKRDQRGVNGCVKTLALLEGQNQADEHIEDKNKRLDEGKATENTVQRVYKAEFDGGTQI